MTDAIRDFRYALRMLIKNPVFTAAAVVTLALGIGLNASTFSAVDGLLFRPLPGAREPEQLVQVYRMWPGMDYGSSSIPHYQDLRDRTSEAFSDVAAWYFAPMSLASEDQSERIMGMLVSANFFQTYGAAPALGRAFIPEEESVGPGAHPVAILGYGFWQGHFGGDPNVVGRTLHLNGHPFQIVGIAPPAFKGPMTVADIPVYVPLMMQQGIDPGHDLIGSRGNNMMNVIARRRPGVSMARAQEVVDAVTARLREELPDYYEGQTGTMLVPQSEAGIHPMFRSAQMGLSAVMMAVVSLLLLLACVNVANLFLTRARERQREMGIRLSLGAQRRHIVQQLLVESFVFAALGGAAGMGLAALSTHVLGGIRPPMDGPWSFSVDMDRRLLLFTAGISVLSGILFGLAPALQAVRPDLVSAVKGASSSKKGRSRMSGGLVVVQMALSLLLLISSGLFLRSLHHATQIDPGFDDPAHVVVASVDPGLQGYDPSRSRQFLDDLLDDVQALPGVRSAGLANWLPLGLSSSDRGVSVPGYEFSEGERQSLQYALVTEGFLEALGVDLMEGRTLTRQDDDEGPPVIVINQHMARRFWPGESAVGKVVRTAGEDRRVIGVVADGKYRSLGEPPTDMMFLPQRELFTTEMTIVARTSGDPATVLQSIQRLVRDADPQMPVVDMRTMEDHMGIALLPARLAASVLGIFGVLGLVLAAVGIYGVTAYSVAQRTREMGIRVAVGANSGMVLRQILREGMKLALIGAVLGLAGAAVAARLVGGLLYDMNALDPVAFTIVPLILVLVSALAVYIPARRAAGVEPMRVLKTE